MSGSGAASRGMIGSTPGIPAGAVDPAGPCGVSGAPAPAPDPWPAEGLEPVLTCPVCGNIQRELLHRNLSDRVFFCAPGVWSLYSCLGCKSAYLDPRPTRETMALAYSRYFTHNPQDLRSWRRRFRRAVANGYRNYRYGTADTPATRLGIVLAWLMSGQRAMADAVMRHLPLPPPGGRLLDVGCGNGEFLDRARASGWSVVGVDPDEQAVQLARRRTLDVRTGGIEVLDPSQEQFDAITLSHVIEHLHHPVAVLRSCYRLLKPGGWIWLDTPNIGSLGYLRYGPHWIHLDPPRHLVLFNSSSLASALETSGFRDVAHQTYRSLCLESFRYSEAIAVGRDPAEAAGPSLAVRRRALAADRQARRRPELRECITVKAVRPD